MASKRARSSGAVRQAFGRVDLGDGDVQAPARQSRRHTVDPAAQRAALAYGRRLEADVYACPFCYGERGQADGLLTHDSACPLR